MTTEIDDDKVYTCEEVGNQHGYLCPECEAGDGLTIEATIQVQARLMPDGVDDEGGDTEWDDTSRVRCDCGWIGMVGDLNEVEVED